MLFSANVKLMKTAIFDMGVTIETTISNNVIRRVQPPFTKMLMVRLLVVLVPIVVRIQQKSKKLKTKMFIMICARSCTKALKPLVSSLLAVL